MDNNEINDVYNAHASEFLKTEDEALVVHASSLYNSRTGTSIRPEHTRDVYEYYRPNERVPEGRNQRELREIIMLCVSAYERVGVIRSVIDMMTDFAAEGIEIVHEDKEPSKFYEVWAQRVKLEDRAERMASWLCKGGNVIVRRKYATISNNEIRKNGVRLPIEYVFYHPATVELVGDSIGSLSSKKIYGLRVPVINLQLNKPKTELEKEVFKSLPPELKDAVLNKTNSKGTQIVRLPSEDIFVGHYKKDDHEIWAKPFLYSILTDVFYNDKLKMAKVSTLDGMINVIRLWKLGDHANKINPIPGYTAKLANILANHPGGGSMDIIWDSAIEMKDYYPPVDKLVNFEENIDAILMGLGVPGGLVGGTSGQGHVATNTIGLKNMMKRIEALRRVITEWLQGEIDLVQEKMGFRKRPHIKFKYEDLHDERVYYKLLIDLVDRNILSDDRILEIINEIPEIERAKIQEQESERENDSRPEKTSPYHNPQLKETQEHQQNINNESKKKPSDNEKPGRPLNSPDKVKRTRGPNKTRQPVGKVISYASRAYDFIDDFVTHLILNKVGVDNVRKLSSEHKVWADQAKHDLLSCLEPNTILSKESLEQTVANFHPDQDFLDYYEQTISETSDDHITVDQKRLIRINAYVYAWGI